MISSKNEREKERKREKIQHRLYNKKMRVRERELINN